MIPLNLRDFHERAGARFITFGEAELVSDYGNMAAEYSALHQTAGVLDLSFRGRICVTGADRARFLHGQVTNDVNRLGPSSGCYAALITAKGKMQSDLNIYNLGDELLLDFEPGLSSGIIQRLERYTIADDVQVVDVAPHYGLLTVQGPHAESIIRGVRLNTEVPKQPLGVTKLTDSALGEVYIINQPRLQTHGYDIFVPVAALEKVAQELIDRVQSAGGLLCGWQAFETARIEAGIPRFGVDMDETNIPLEAEIEERAISFKKGCYIGQEVISRIKTYGQVTKSLRGLALKSDFKSLPKRGDKLFRSGKEVGYITSAIASPAFKTNIALGYVRKETNQVGTVLTLQTGAGETEAQIVKLPFSNPLY